MIISENQGGDGPSFASCPIREHIVTGWPRGIGKGRPMSQKNVNTQSWGSEVE